MRTVRGLFLPLLLPLALPLIGPVVSVPCLAQVDRTVSPAEAAEPLQPGMSVRVVRETPLGQQGGPCDGPRDPYLAPLECLSRSHPIDPHVFPWRGQPIGFDAAGNFYHWANLYASYDIQFDAARRGYLIQRVTPEGVTEDVLRLFSVLCVAPADCSQPDPDPRKQFWYSPVETIDAANGRLLVQLTACFFRSQDGCVDYDIGTIEISGLPTRRLPPGHN